ncbi:serine/threonine protein kinase [Leptolyngbya sp. FACHB-321]|uniref:serine/threonine-protein kinase n=1 Tax=Leptolyngbya sp. FACHB-321 TaxID=2692807 RepID=UPI001688BA2B|nr:serine/threonine-protein kinase [Leptolyngbya sp. FACHB-321]MBD2037175.1 serine/threonine protein kinase [Leptolyngbya sp. FACHB-321]
MVPPLPSGTVLRQRYLIQQVLGQGGFGRTYLALDQERFNEPCVLKEFIVPYHDGTLIEKSKTLFHREASTLYQIQHPQIPRFWAAFEDEKRFFLVQDFVDGQTYRQLLSDRKQKGQTFSDAEVLYFLSHLLPVLACIHSQGIIHRDISPENVILQTQATTQLEPTQTLPEAGLPVLIDFGAVKEATSHWPLMSTPTRVGKVGYAPPEQLQTGRVYPNSDLYALAATALVLLTGREPQTLLDSRTLTWNWEPYAYVSDELAMVLRRMLAVYPGDRYQTATEVLQDLQSFGAIPLESTLLRSPDPAAPSPDQPAIVNFLSPQSDRLTQTAKTPQPISQQTSTPAPVRAPSRRSPHTSDLGWRRWDNIGGKVRAGIAATLLASLGIALPIVWQLGIKAPDTNGEVWVSGAKLPQSEASRIIDAPDASGSNLAIKPPFEPNQAEPNQTETTRTDGAVVKTSKPLQRLQFARGKVTTAVQGHLQATEMQPYMLQASQGQIMSVTLQGQGAVMNLLRSNQEAIDAASHQTRSWTGQLPADDRYMIQVSGTGAYTLDVAITPLARPTQEQIQQVAFAPGNSGTTVTGQIAPNQLQRYLLKAKQGQILVVKVLQGSVSFSAIAPNGQRIGSNATNTKSWQGRLPQDGAYMIEVSGNEPEGYAIALEVL